MQKYEKRKTIKRKNKKSSQRKSNSAEKSVPEECEFNYIDVIIMDIKELKDVLPQKIIEDAKKAFVEFGLTEAQKQKAIEKILMLYKKSRFEPGEAAGVITAQSVSEPATQMCIDGGEKIILKNGEGIFIKRIGEFTEECFKGFGMEKIGEFEVSDLPDENLFVLALNNEEKFVWKKLLACNRHKSPEKLIKIKTASGREILATNFHSFVIRKDNNILSIAGKDLKKGDRIPAIKYLPENCVHSISLPAFMPAVKFSVNDGVVSLPRSPSVLPEQIELDGIFGWFIGAYLSEGCCGNNEVCISNTDKRFIEKFRKFSEKLRLNSGEFDHHRGFAWSHDMKIRSALFTHFIRNACSEKSKGKKVPIFAYSANENFISSLLRGYFDGDGNVNVGRKMIRVSSNSEELVNGIKLLLARFGIFASKSFNKGQWWLHIPYKYADIFASKIGSDINEKKQNLGKLAQMSKKFWQTSSQDYTDMIPGFGNILYDTAKKLKYPTRYVNNFTKRQKIGRTTLYRYTKLFENIARERNIEIAKELAVMKRMLNSDVVWDEIVGISYEKPTSEFVFDLSVEDARTFATFDGIVIHNTMRSYQLAGAVEIKVTQGLPRLIEIFDARKEPVTPMMTIYLQKSWNTKEKAKQIVAEIQELKLGDIIVEDAWVDILNMQIEYVFSESKLKHFGLSIPKILEMLKEIKGIEAKAKTRSIIIKPKAEAEIRDLQKMKAKILETHIKGIKGISQAIISEEENEWVIKTLGTNLEKILTLKGVDATRTTTNDIHEIARVLGVEAARSAILREASRTLHQQGLEVDIRHILLIADVMTMDGTIKPIGRYGVAGAKGSLLARANFEETIKHLTTGSLRGETDTLESIVENVMINQVAPIGTGMFDLAFSPKKEKTKE